MYEARHLRWITAWQGPTLIAMTHPHTGISGGNPDRVCPNCGWPESVLYNVVSRHLTSTGMIVYSRCVCGALQVRHLTTSGGTGLVARGAPVDHRFLSSPNSRPAPCGG